MMENMKEQKENIQKETGKEADFQYDKLYDTSEGNHRVHTEDDNHVSKKKSKRLWIIAAVALAVVILLTGAYGSIAVYYQTHFFKNTTINDINASHMEAAAITASLDRQAKEFKVEIFGRDEGGQKVLLGDITAEDIGYVYTDTYGAVNAILEAQNEWLWFMELGNNHKSYSLVQGVTFDSEMLREKLLSFEAFQKEKMIAPVDAYISDFSEEKQAYEIIQEITGTTFDVEQAISHIETAIIGDSAAKEITIDLLEQGYYQNPSVMADDKKLTKSVEEINKWLSTEIVYDWNGNEIKVDSTVIKEWTSFENGQPVLDESAIAEFVNKNANDFDTSGKNTTFTTALGVPMNLPRLSYGWKTDRESEIAELTRLIREGGKQEREPVYFRKGVWKGQNDIGNSYIEADLTHQHLYVFDKGAIVFETDFVSGDMNKPDCVSPAGIFGLTYKTLNAVLRGADYETPVTYWMPFYGNFGMHDATWRDTFGGEIYLTDQGSHGCLNLPLESAALIYNYVYEGSPIICYYY